MKKIVIILTLFNLIFFVRLGKAQQEDESVIQNIYDHALTSDIAYKQLGQLCKETPGRLIGTPNSFKAVDIMKSYLEDIGADTVFLQHFTSPAWICKSASAAVIINGREISLKVDALGPSGSTSKQGIYAEIIEVMGLDEVRELGKEKIEGKIVFYNRPMNTTYFNVFKAYGEAVDQRYWGPSLAQEFGAVGSITRSANPNLDDFPHTGSCKMEGKKIPAIAISTNDAEKLSTILKSNPRLKVKIKVDAEDIITQSYNLIADLKGSEKPDEFIVVAGHIDAWHTTEGAHDDGVGCLQSTEVLRLFKELKIRNKRSIRVILYMDEELYQSGGHAYVNYSKSHPVTNYFAIESDAGGFSPRFFSVDAPDMVLEKIKKYASLLKPYGIDEIASGGSGVDIGPLKDLGVPLSGYRSDWQRYFDMHHSANDTFEHVNFREMQLGSGAMASLVYLIDTYNLADKE